MTGTLVRRYGRRGQTRVEKCEFPVALTGMFDDNWRNGAEEERTVTKFLQVRELEAFVDDSDVGGEEDMVGRRTIGVMMGSMRLGEESTVQGRLWSTGSGVRRSEGT